jgi:hypothetical protein
VTPDPQAIAARVRNELDHYGVPEPDPRALGTSLPPEWFIKNLKEMREALVDPYLLRLEWAGRDVLVVADDKDGSLVAYDPCEEGEFALLLRENNEIYDCHVRADAVGCFLSR